MSKVFYACVLSVCVPALASAQTLSPRGWAIGRLDPAPAGDAFVLAEHPRYTRAWSAAAGVTFDVAFDPLRVRRTYADRSVAVIDAMTFAALAHLNGSLSIARRVSFDLSLPISITQAGDGARLGTVAVTPSAVPVVGDARLGARVGIVGTARDTFSLHAGAWLWLPTGSRTGNTGDGAVRIEPRLIAAGTAGRVRWSLTTAVMFRRELDAANVAIGTELRLTGAAWFSLAAGRVWLGPEVYVVTPLRATVDGAGPAFFAPGQWGVEAMASGSWAMTSTLALGGALGMGFERAVGVPAARAVLSLTWHGPRQNDRSDAHADTTTRQNP